MLLHLFLKLMHLKSSEPTEECVSCDKSRDDIDPEAKKQGDSVNVINPVKREYTLCHKTMKV